MRSPRPSPPRTPGAILHLDLKPSNLLLADDGQPMLLDFHLARGPLARGAPHPDRLGGTVGYMSPEHELAFDAVSAQGLQVRAARRRAVRASIRSA